MVINVKALVGSCDTNAQGDIVRAVVLDSLRHHETVTVSFSGILNATSSFVNSAFVDLLDDMSVADFKRRVRITGATRQIIHMIKYRIDAVSKPLEPVA